MGQDEERKDFSLLSLLQKREFRNGEYKIKMPIRNQNAYKKVTQSLPTSYFPTTGDGGGKYSEVIFRNST